MDVTEIISGLWIGSKKNAHSTNFLTTKHIEVVINCKQMDGAIDRVSGLDNLRENESMKMYKWLPIVTEYLHTQLKSLKNVLVYCQTGIQRSPTVIASYLIRYGGINVDTAIEVIRTKRIVAFSTGFNFKKVLLQFQNDLSSEKTDTNKTLR